MRLATLVLLAGCAALLVNAQDKGLEIRAVTIEEILRQHPGLKKELSEKIKSVSTSDTPATATEDVAPKALDDATNATSADTTAADTTTTSAPQADAPPAPTESTTPTNAEEGQRRPGRRRNGRRRPDSVKQSERFAEAPHRLSATEKDGSEAPSRAQRQNGRQFPGTQ
ncbi:uncharacterized protein [Procambarus clarkii]|uniref:uncharacterized protein n=1 Tax=Procambarus clarkii TaxID=6728 RepID=UPI0037430481